MTLPPMTLPPRIETKKGIRNCLYGESDYDLYFS